MSTTELQQRAIDALGPDERLTGETYVGIDGYTIFKTEPPRDDQALAYRHSDDTLRWRLLPPPGTHIAESDD